jgi:hypothetical protein
MRDKGIDYHVNSRCATYAQPQAASENPIQSIGDSRHFLGLAASGGLEPDAIKSDGV